MIFKQVFVEVSAGPFAPLVGFIGAIMGAIFLIRQIVWGTRQLWATPGDVLPKTAIRIVGILSGIGMVVIWLNAKPDTLTEITWLAIGMGITCLLSFISYYYIESRLTLNDPKLNAKIIAGFVMNEEAKQLKAKGLKRQEILEGSLGASYVWTESSISAAKMVLLSLYLAIMISGTIGITAAGCLVQVKLTNKATYEVIDRKQAPGLDSAEKVNKKKPNH